MENNNLNFIDPSRNDRFSSLRGLDLQELIVQIENFYLIYRKTLNLPKEVTFGIEIEYEGVSRSSVYNFVNEHNYYGWISKYDGSLNSGGEIVSPVLHDKECSWKEIQEICHYLKSKNADTLHNAGGHIHIGAHILGDSCEKWRRFLKVYTAYESLLFRFTYGDKISGRAKLFQYARPIADELYYTINRTRSMNNLFEIKWHLPTADRYQAINFRNVDFYNIEHHYQKNTLEFRNPNASIEEIIWQNNINTFSKMLLSPDSPTFDEDFLDYKLRNERVSSQQDLYMYNEVCLKNALEFVDIIFDNNLDKVYFLRQYIKGFENNFEITTAVKSKKFIK